MRHLTGLLLIALLAGGSLAAPLSIGPRYKDESSGFQIQLPRKWEQVPTKFQEVSILGKWVGKAKRGYMHPAGYVIRILNAAEEEPETPGEAVQRGIPGYAGLLRDQPKTVWEFVEQFFYGGGFEVVEDDAEFKMSSKRYKAHYRLYKEKEGGPGGRDADKRQRLIAAAAIEPVEGGDSVYGVVYACTVADEKDMLRAFETSIKRFKILEPDEDEEPDEDGGAPIGDEGIFVDSTKKPEIWREARKNKLIPGWEAIDTQNYLIVYNKEVKKRLITTVAKHIEAIRADVYERLFPPAHEIKAVSVVRVCKDREEYHRYGGPGGSAGYWSRGDEELVFYQDKSNKKDSLRVLYHEAFHQYIHYAVGDVAPHSWLHDGDGEYFACDHYRGGKSASTASRWRNGLIATALGQKTYVPLDKFLKYSQGEYYANPGLCYAQGWSLVYFLREVEARKIKQYEKYWGLLDRYFEAIKRNVSSVKEQGLEGLNEEEPPPDPLPEEHEEAAPSTPPTPPGLPRLPGLEQPFPGEHPLAGAGTPSGEAGGESDTGGGRTVAGPVIRDARSALDAAVDEVFLKNPRIDIKELEKDWVEWSK